MLRTLLVLAILIPGFIAAFRNQFAALCLYTWFALFRPQEWLWFDVSQFRLSLIIGLMLIVPSFLGGALPNLTHPISICTLVFLGSSLVAQTNAVAPEVGWQWIDYMVRLGAVCLLLPALTTTRERFVALVCIVAVSFGVHSTIAGFNSVLGSGERVGEGVGGAFTDNNGYAMGIAMILPLMSLAAQNQSNRWSRWALFAGVPLSAFTAISTFSRAGFLAIIVCGATFVLLQRRRFAALAVAVPLCAMLLLTVGLPDGYTDRMRTIQTYEEIEETSALSRLHFWKVAVEMLKDHPLGIGLQNFEATYDRYDSLDGLYGRGRSVHNSHIQALVETGYVGGLAYLALLGFSLRSAFRARRFSRTAALPEPERDFYWTSANGLIAALMGFVVGGAFIALALNDLLWMIAALAATLEILSQRRASELVRETGTDAAPRLRNRFVPARRYPGRQALPLGS